MSRRRDRRQARREEANSKSTGSTEPSYDRGLSQTDRVAAVDGHATRPSIPGERALFAIPFVLTRGGDKEAETKLLARFADRIVGLLQEDPEFSEIRTAQDGEEAIRALSTAMYGQELIAEARAAQKARNN